MTKQSNFRWRGRVSWPEPEELRAGGGWYGSILHALSLCFNGSGSGGAESYAVSYALCSRPARSKNDQAGRTHLSFCDGRHPRPLNGLFHKCTHVSAPQLQDAEGLSDHDRFRSSITRPRHSLFTLHAAITGADAKLAFRGGQPFPGGIPVYPPSSVWKFPAFGFPVPWASLGAVGSPSEWRLDKPQQTRTFTKNRSLGMGGHSPVAGVQICPLAIRSGPD